MTENELLAYDIGFADAMRAFSYMEGRQIRVGGPMSSIPLSDAMERRGKMPMYKPRLGVGKSSAQESK